MKIPNEVKIAGLTIKTVFDTTFAGKEGCLGKADYMTQTITIDPGCAPGQTVQQSYLHELIHWVLFVQNEHEKRNDEKFVDTFAHLLYQALESGEIFLKAKKDKE